MDNFIKNKDPTFLMLENADDATLFSFCEVNKKTAAICRDQNFWRRRFIKKYGSEAARYKPEKRTWRNHYLKMIIDLEAISEQYREDGPKGIWLFFSDIKWDMRTPPTLENIFFQGDVDLIPFSEMGEKYVNAFYLLNLGNVVDIEPYFRQNNIKYDLQTWDSGNNTKKYFAPVDVLRMLYDYYQQQADAKELEIAMWQGDDAIDYTEADLGRLQKLDLLGNRTFFRGFSYYIKNKKDVFSLILEDLED